MIGASASFGNSALARIFASWFGLRQICHVLSKYFCPLISLHFVSTTLAEMEEKARLCGILPRGAFVFVRVRARCALPSCSLPRVFGPSGGDKTRGELAFVSFGFGPLASFRFGFGPFRRWASAREGLRGAPGQRGRPRARFGRVSGSTHLPALFAYAHYGRRPRARLNTLSICFTSQASAWAGRAFIRTA